jgi:hypothetical protein
VGDGSWRIGKMGKGKGQVKAVAAASCSPYSLIVIGTYPETMDGYIEDEIS